MPDALDANYQVLKDEVIDLALRIGTPALHRIAKAADAYHAAVQTAMTHRTYKHTLDDADVGALRKIHQHVIETQRYEVDVRKAGLSYTERSRVTQLRFHGLLAKALNKSGNHKQSTWILTKRGAQFLKNEIGVPRWVESKANHLTGKKADELLWARDFRILDDFGPHFQIVDVDPAREWVAVVPLPTQQLTIA